MMMMMMMMKDAWRYPEEDGRQTFDVTSASAADSWEQETTAEQFHDEGDNVTWRSTTEDGSWQQDHGDAGQDDWTTRADDQSSDWTLTGGATEYDSGWAGDYNMAADDNYTSNDDY